MNSKTEKIIDKIDTSSLSELIYFLESFGKPYFIHAGFGLHLYGFSSELDDIDVKVFYDNLEDIYSSALSFFGDKVKMNKGEVDHFGSYMFPRIEIDLKTPIDICTRTGAINNLGEVEFPFSLDVFKNIEYFNYNGIRVPVSSLESIFLYYLVLRRGLNDQKNDSQKIREILGSNKFSKDKFFNLIQNHPKKKEIINLFNSYLETISI